jgi:hypothetical protein
MMCICTYWGRFTLFVKVRPTTKRRSSSSETFFAWHRQIYTCSGNCGSAWNNASGSEGSNSSRLAACEAARATACSEATCQSGTYQFCTLQYSYSGTNGGTGSCTYNQIRDCAVGDDCTFN